MGTPLCLDQSVETLFECKAKEGKISKWKTVSIEFKEIIEAEITLNSEVDMSVIQPGSYIDVYP